ncbi:ferredoxin [Candidatus Peregrinibacteria bacterium]|nr:ferredoxin [Candidatus Peregrinibacteria bacterium]
MAVKVDPNLCIGCGTCSTMCPKVFKIDEEGKSSVIDENGDTPENIKAAADACPTRAILIE